MLTILEWLAETLGLGALKVWLAARKSTAQQLGEAVETSSVAQKEASVEAAEAQAAVNAPVSNEAMAKLLEAGKLCVAMLLLSSCTHAQGVSYPNCLPLREWSVVDQQNAKADLETLPPDSPVWAFIQDYARIREEIKACQSLAEGN